VLASRRYQKALTAKGYGAITTEIAQAGPFYFAETYHQQYLAKNPHGYCGIGGTGVVCSIGTGVALLNFLASLIRHSSGRNELSTGTAESLSPTSSG
jgi:hypothetical protein